MVHVRCCCVRDSQASRLSSSKASATQSECCVAGDVRYGTTAPLRTSAPTTATAARRCNPHLHALTTYDKHHPHSKVKAFQHTQADSHAAHAHEMPPTRLPRATCLPTSGGRCSTTSPSASLSASHTLPTATTRSWPPNRGSRSSFSQPAVWRIEEQDRGKFGMICYTEHGSVNSAWMSRV